MGRVVFRNPNNPEQPAEGVYRWFFVSGQNREITFYIGESGDREHGPAFRPSTLARGVSELQRATGLSANSGRTLTTRFIVGTAIKYLTEMGYKCVWEHISGNPCEERNLCNTCRPILQDGNAPHILSAFRLKRRDRTSWDNSDPRHVRQAEKRLYRLFDKYFGCR